LRALFVTPVAAGPGEAPVVPHAPSADSAWVNRGRLGSTPRAAARIGPALAAADTDREPRSADYLAGLDVGRREHARGIAESDVRATVERGIRAGIQAAVMRSAMGVPSAPFERQLTPRH
jgi:hypothetical protein